jgi:phage shock protein C
MTQRLTRDPRHATLGGVAAGLAQYLQVDATLVRLAFVLLAFVHGFGILAYIVCWVVMPVEGMATASDATASPGDRVAVGVHAAAEEFAAGLERAGAGLARAHLAVGYGLVFLGVALLLDNLGWIYWPRWVTLSTLWPLILVAMGAGLVSRSLRRRTS